MGGECSIGGLIKRGEAVLEINSGPLLLLFATLPSFLHAPIVVTTGILCPQSQSLAPTPAAITPIERSKTSSN